jgi:hypothetical protein
MCDETYVSSEDDYDWIFESSSISSDDCGPKDESDKRGDHLQWSGVVRNCARYRSNMLSYSKTTQENHPSRLLNKALIAEVRDILYPLIGC